MEVKEINKSTVVVGLQGAVILSNSPGIKEALKLLIRQGKVNIVISLAEVSFIDTSGLVIFVSCLKETKPEGSLKLVEVPPESMKVFELMELSSIFEIYESVNDALASYK